MSKTLIAMNSKLVARNIRTKQYHIIFILNISLLTVSALSIGDLVIKALYLVSFHILGQFTKILD